MAPVNDQELFATTARGPMDEPRPANDEALIALAIGGDTEAFGRLMTCYAPIIQGLLIGRLHHREEAEDLLQETFISAWQNLPRLRSAERLGPWLVRIARNKLIDHYRRQKRRPPIEIIDLNNEGPEFARSGEAANPPQDAYHRLAEAETRATVIAAIGELPEKYRIVLYLQLIDEMPHGTIAQRLGLKDSAVKMRLKRGLARLHAKLNKRQVEWWGDERP